MTQIVVMPGGFHPFHAGHLALYNSAREAFPDAEVYVAATNDTSSRPFPFAVKEKLAKLAGVEPGHFVQVKSPFRAEEITAKFDPAQDTLIFVRSQKDAGSPPQPGGTKKDGSPAYLQPLAGAESLEPFARHAYMAYLPTVEFGPGMTSATQIRTAWPGLNDKRKTALVMSLYPRTQTNPKLAATVAKLLDAAIGTQEVTEGKITLSTDPNWYGAEVGNYKASGPVVNIPSNRLVGFEPDDKMNQPNSKANVEKIVSGLKQGDKLPPLLVRKYKNGYQVLDGHHRFWAYKMLGVKSIPAQIVPDSDIEEKGQQGVAENQGWAATYETNTQNFVGGMKAGYQARENQPIDEDRRGNLEGDPELKQAKLFAKQHYPEFAGDEEMAFDKWVQRSLHHSEEEDAKHSAAIRRLSAKITDLQQQLQKAKSAFVQEDLDYIEEKWSQKYKSSINCANPKGFSQRAHCAGRKK